MLLTTIALAKKKKTAGVSSRVQGSVVDLRKDVFLLIWALSPSLATGSVLVRLNAVFFSINWFSVSLCLTGTIISSANTSQSQTGVMGQVWLGKAWPDLQKGGMRKPICRPETPIQGLFTFAFKIINHCTCIWTCMNVWHSD